MMTTPSIARHLVRFESPLDYRHMFAVDGDVLRCIDLLHHVDVVIKHGIRCK
jgi:hypothetical protein